MIGGDADTPSPGVETLNNNKFGIKNDIKRTQSMIGLLRNIELDMIIYVCFDNLNFVSFIAKRIFCL